MKEIIEGEFPCGYKYRIENEHGLFDVVLKDSQLLKECPLHGKNCPPKKIHFK